MDADEQANAHGDVLCVRLELPIDQLLERAVKMKESEGDVVGTLVEVKYEKVPHFDEGVLLFMISL